MHPRLLTWNERTAYIIDPESKEAVACVEIAPDGSPAINSTYNAQPADVMLAIWLVSRPKDHQTVFARACGLSENEWSVEHAVTFVFHLVLWLQQQPGDHSWIVEARNMKLSAPQCRSAEVPSQVFAQYMSDLAASE